MHSDRWGAWSLLDFECCGVGWRAYDLSVFRWETEGRVSLGQISERTAQRRWKAFVEGYSNVRRLTEEELSAIIPLSLARHIWVMGLQARVAPEPRQLPVLDQMMDVTKTIVESSLF